MGCNMHCMQAACWSCTERPCSLSWTSLRLTNQSMLSLVRIMGQCRPQQKQFESYELQPAGFSLRMASQKARHGTQSAVLCSGMLILWMLAAETQQASVTSAAELCMSSFTTW